VPQLDEAWVGGCSVFLECWLYCQVAQLHHQLDVRWALFSAETVAALSAVLPVQHAAACESLLQCRVVSVGGSVVSSARLVV